MPKARARYAATLESMDPAAWDRYLLDHSGLPGPRGNIELGQAAADLASPVQIEAWAARDASAAPTGTAEEFLAFCGVLGIGRLAAEGDEHALRALRGHAGDRRWRVREAVAMALQRVGRDDFDRLLTEVELWAEGTRLEQRAAAAALCEPSLLATTERVVGALAILDTITTSMIAAGDRRTDEFVALRKGMGYCWSVAVAADLTAGRPGMERWITHEDRDIRWVMRSNLGKKRLERADAAWVARQQEILTSAK